MQSQAFTIYVTPPRVVLANEHVTLVQARLVPNAIIRVSDITNISIMTSLTLF